MGKISGILALSRYYLSFLDYDFLKVTLGSRNAGTTSNREHVDMAIRWLCQAQDADSSDNGVSRSYSLLYHPYFNKKGWVGSYPETTGYIIPTMFDYAGITGHKEYYDRAIRMADWECSVQLKNGAVQGGTIDQKPTPAIFNTGQVIFGWLRAYEETKNPVYLEAAKRAGDYLVGEQSEDGSWRKNLSDYAGGAAMKYYTYNTRAAWALMALSQKADSEQNYSRAAIRNIDFALRQQNDNGWFKSNCLNKPAEPLVHTIAYCIRGILEVGLQQNNQHFIDKARLAADALAAVQRTDGSLAGRYDKNWHPTVDWSCLTGNAQTAIIWGKLYRLTGEKKYLDSMQRINIFLKRVQIDFPAKDNLHGGICGSHPANGLYGQYEILNWAVKFFIDALLLEDLIADVLPANVYDGPHS